MFLDQFPFWQTLPIEAREIILRILGVLLALIVIWILRRMLTGLFIAPLRRLAARTTTQLDDLLIDAAIAPIRVIIIALALLLSAAILQVELVLVGHIVRTLLIIAVVMLINQLINLLIPSSNRLFAITGITLEERLIPFVRVATKFVLIILGVVMVLQEWGYDVSGVVAGIGLGGLAFSLAAQDTLANLFGFIAIVGDRPFNVGDFIKTPDVEGIVEHVGLRSTRVRQMDQALVMVPNSKLAGAAVLNWSRLSRRRIDYVLGITYDANSNQVRVLLDRMRALLKSQELVDPESVVVNLIDFGEHSLNILVRAYVNIPEWVGFTNEKERLHLEIMDIIQELGLTIAKPRQALYIESLPEMQLNEQEIRALSQREQAILRDAPPTVAPHQDEPDK